MRIEKIEVKNLKAINEAELELAGKSVIVTAGNDKGKSTLLRGLIDRFHGEKPDYIVKKGEKKGFYFMELTDGSRIEWKFTEKGESFAYITKEGLKVNTGVLTGIGERYFGKKFDIDRFLQASPKEQTKTMQMLVGLDFTDLDEKYQKAYEKRREINADLSWLRSKGLKKPMEVEKVDIDLYEKEIKDAKAENEKRRAEWRARNEAHIAEIKKWNEEVEIQKEKYEEAIWAVKTLEEVKGSVFETAVDWNRVSEILVTIPKPKDKKELTMLEEPEYLDIQKMEAKYSEARSKHLEYERYQIAKKEYEEWVSEGKQMSKKLEKVKNELSEIIEARKKRIAKANIPAEFEITDEGLMYNGLPLNTNQISSSAKYIAALKLGSLVLGEVKALHFDAGLLDKNNLKEVREWAEKNNLQLLIEKPDYEAGEIRYEIA